MNCLRYSPDIEQPDPGEDKAIDGIIAAMTRQSPRVAEHEGHAVRASHAKNTGLVTGQLTVSETFPRRPIRPTLTIFPTRSTPCP